MDVIKKFYARVVMSNGCHNWVGGKTGAGYGMIYADGRFILAHRWIYTHEYGPIKPKYVIDHMCNNRACVNPLHLQQITHGANTLRGTSPSATHARKTHCVHGHSLLDSDNVFVDGRCKRRCRECTRIKARAYRLKMKGRDT